MIMKLIKYVMIFCAILFIMIISIIIAYLSHLFYGVGKFNQVQSGKTGILDGVEFVYDYGDKPFMIKDKLLVNRIEKSLNKAKEDGHYGKTAERCYINLNYKPWGSTQSTLFGIRGSKNKFIITHPNSLANERLFTIELNDSDAQALKDLMTKLERQSIEDDKKKREKYEKAHGLR